MSDQEVKPLSDNIKSRLRSGIRIPSIVELINELVFNSLDAKATAIAIRLNLIKFHIQVVDNGNGISKKNMSVVGTRYMTNKFTRLKDIAKNTYGFRGELLASLSTMAKRIEITSKRNDASETYRKICRNFRWDEPTLTTNRASCGTTIIIDDFSYNFPVRKKRINQSLHLNEIKHNLEVLAIIHPKVSITLRDEVNLKLIFQKNRTESVLETLKYIHFDLKNYGFLEMKVRKDKITISGIISKIPSINNKLQYIYVNKRPIKHSNVHKSLNGVLQKSTIVENSKTDFPIYVFNIKYRDASPNLLKPFEEFDLNENTLNCIENCLWKFLDREGLLVNNPKKDEKPLSSKRSVGISQIQGAVKSNFIKRKRIDEEAVSLEENSKESDETDLKMKTNSEEQNNVISSKKCTKKLNTLTDEFPKIKSYKVLALKRTESKDEQVSTSKKSMDKNSVNEFPMESVTPTKKPRNIAARKTKNVQTSKKNNQLAKLLDEHKCTSMLKMLRDNPKLSPRKARNKNALKLGLKQLEVKIDEAIENQNLKSVFERHQNTQSLVLNSDLTEIASNINNMKKGKDVIMRKFLDSDENQETKDKDTMTVSVKITNKYVENKMKRISDKKSTVSKCIQTTMDQKDDNDSVHQGSIHPNLEFLETRTAIQEKQFEITFNKNADFDYEDVKQLFDQNCHPQRNTSNFSKFHVPFEQPVVSPYFIKSDKQFYSKSTSNLHSEIPHLGKMAKKSSNGLTFPSLTGIVRNNSMQMYGLGNEEHNWGQRPPFSLSPYVARNVKILNSSNYHSYRKQQIGKPTMGFKTFPDLFIKESTSEYSISFNTFPKELDNNVFPYFRNLQSNFNTSWQKPVKSWHFKPDGNDFRKPKDTLLKIGEHPYQPKFQLRNRRYDFNHRKATDNSGFLYENSSNKYTLQKSFLENFDCTNEFLKTKPSTRYVRENLENPLLERNSRDNFVHSLLKETETPQENFDFFNLGTKQRREESASEFRFKSDFLTDPSECKHLFGFSKINKKIIEDQQANEFYQKENNQPKINENPKQADKVEEKINHALYGFDKLKISFPKTDIPSNVQLTPINLIESIKKISSPKNSRGKNGLDKRSYEEDIIAHESKSVVSPENRLENSLLVDSVITPQNQEDLINETYYEQVDLKSKKVGKKCKRIKNCYKKEKGVRGIYKDIFNTEIQIENPKSPCNQIGEEINNSLKEQEFELPQVYNISDTSFHLAEKSINQIDFSFKLFEKENYEVPIENPFKTDKNTGHLFVEQPKNTENLFENPFEAEKTEFNVNLFEQVPEWTQRFNEDGDQIYLNKRTGMNSKLKPEVSNPFTLKKRIDFLPKGHSFIMDEKEAITASISPQFKKELHEAVLKSYECELSAVKWKDFVDKNDAEAFFKKLYEDKSRHFEGLIPAAVKPLLKFNKVDQQTLSKESFDCMEVIGQLDCKFIVTWMKKEKMVILFDQHAVHERIRLETLLNDYTEDDGKKLKKTTCPGLLNIKLDESDLRIISHHKKNFENLGLLFKMKKNYIKITDIPLCVHRKKRSHGDDALHDTIKCIIEEEIELIKSTRIAILLPPIINKIIATEACRGAVKFGDKLSMQECTQHLNKLKKCKLPFQCAHGRPTFAVIVNLTLSQLNREKVPPNLKNLRK